MSQRRDNDSSLRYERLPPVASCTRCGAPLWGGDICRVMVYDRPERLGVERDWTRVLKECWQCSPSGGAPGGHGPRAVFDEGEEVNG